MRILLPALAIVILVACGKRERPDPTEPTEPNRPGVEAHVARVTAP